VGSPVFPNFTTPPNVGPEPSGLAAAVSKIFQGTGASPAQAAAPPDPYALTDQQLVQLLEDTKGFCDPGRELFEYGWWRNLLYLLGRQWIYWNPTSRQWQDKRLAKWIPKPVTNIIRTTILSIRATTQAIDLSSIIRPTGADPANIQTAQTLDDLEPVLKEEHKADSLWQMADYTAGLFGDAFLHAYWDTSDPSHTVTVDLWQCAACQATSPDDAVVKANQRCPQCQSPMLTKSGTTQLPIGQGKTLVVSPLELLLPLYAQSWAEVDRLVFMTWRPQHQIEEEYSDLKNEKGQPILASVQYDQGPSQRSLQLYKAIATTSDLNLTPSVWSATAFTGQVKGASEFHLWMKPSKKYPKGFYCRFLGDGQGIPLRLLGADGQPLGFQLPYTKLSTGQPIWPWARYAFEPIYGRLYSQGAVDSIIQKQDQINQIDSMTQMVAQRMGNPIWLEQKGAAVERFTGEPGIIVRWQSVGSGGKPERMDGLNPPSSFFTMREQFKADAEELAGTYDVLKGEKPSGVEAYAALNLLVERSQSRFATLFKSRAMAYRDWLEIVIEMERSYGPTSRVQAVLGPNKSWTFQTFRKADLTGDVSILIDDGSTVPKTALGRRAAIEHANQLGLLATKTPAQTYTMFQELGVASLAPNLDAYMKSALQEQQAFEEWLDGNMQGPSPLVREPWHDDRTHLDANQVWMNGDKIRDFLKRAPPEIAQNIRGMLAAHLATHAMNLAPPTPQPKVAVNISPKDGDVTPGTPQYDSVAQLTGLPHGPGGNVAHPGGPGAPGGPGTAPPGTGTPGGPQSPAAAGAAQATANSNRAGHGPNAPPNPHPAPPSTHPGVH
jgi:hypothetical protein